MNRSRRSRGRPGSGWPFAAGVLLLVLSAGPSFGQAPAEDPTALVNSLLSGLLGVGEKSESELQAEVAATGGVPFKTPVRLEYMGRSELKRYVADMFEAEYSAAESEADRRTLLAFDLLEESADLRALRAKVLEENVVGFYDERPESRRLYVVSEERRLTPMNQLVLSHELRHALQDQYMTLHDLVGDDVSDYDDRSLALLSLLEGDATLVMERFLLSRLPGGGQGLTGLGADSGGFFGLGAMAGAAVPGAPPVVRDQLVLPYFAGRDFVSALFAKGGWAKVMEAWAHPPASTEQVLHPEKYLAGEAPRLVHPPAGPAGGRMLREGVLGEALLRTWLGEGGEEAAAGWGGDGFRVHDVNGRTVLRWRSEWDTATEGIEFLGAARRRMGGLGASLPREGWDIWRRGAWTFALGTRAAGVELISSDSGALFEAALRQAGRGEEAPFGVVSGLTGRPRRPPLSLTGGGASPIIRATE